MTSQARTIRFNVAVSVPGKSAVTSQTFHVKQPGITDNISSDRIMAQIKVDLENQNVTLVDTNGDVSNSPYSNVLDWKPLAVTTTTKKEV
jgi:hypothetical protein